MKRIVLATVTATILLAGGAMSAAASAQASPPNGGASHRSDPPCSISPNPAGLDQDFTISATNLPAGPTVELIKRYPNGTTETGPIAVASDGTYTLTQSSASSVFPTEQTGTYTYQFVSKVRWPQDTFNQTYATCSVSVG